MYISGESSIQADTSLVTAAIRSPKVVLMFSGCLMVPLRVTAVQ